LGAIRENSLERFAKGARVDLALRRWNMALNRSGEENVRHEGAALERGLAVGFVV
jgi:hypothetical protein